MILNDGDTGHFRQCEAVCDEAQSIYLQRGIPGIDIRIESLAVGAAANRLRTKRERLLRRLSKIFRHRCQGLRPGCAKCLRECFCQCDFDHLDSMRADIVVSTEGIVELNLWLSRLWGARSITVLGIRSAVYEVDLAFVLRITPFPIDASNIVVLDGVPNMMTPTHLERHANAFRQEIGPLRGARIGCLLGGDVGDLAQHPALMANLLSQLEGAAVMYDADLLVSTSRRTSPTTERIVKQRFTANSRCRLLVIANEQNRTGTVEAILGLSDVVLVSPDSISMVSEAASAKPNVVVYEDPNKVGLDYRFVEYMQRRGFLDLLPVTDVARGLNPLAASRHPQLDDRRTLRAALETVL